MEMESAPQPQAGHNAKDTAAVDGRDAVWTDSTASSRTEEIVCVVARTANPGGYDVLSLKEASTEQQNSFVLSSRPAADLPQPLLDQLLVDGIPEQLRATVDRRVHLVVSTRSGTGLALDFYSSVLCPLLRSLGLSPAAETPGEHAQESTVAEAQTQTGTQTYDLTITQDGESIRKFAEGLNATSGPQEHCIVLLSGDGGVVEMLNGQAARHHQQQHAAADKSPPPPPLIAMLPLGTGNALFHSLHKPVYAAFGASPPSPLVLGLRTLLKGHRAPLPSFKASFSPGARTVRYRDSAEPEAEAQTHAVSHLHGAIVASYGFHSQLVWESDTPAYRRHGDKRFGMLAAELLKESHAYDAAVRITRSAPGGAASPPPPRTELLERRRHSYVLATLVSNLERAFTASPASRPLDGQLRLVHFGAVGGDKTMEIMQAAYDGGRHVGMTWTSGDDDAREEGAVGYEELDEVSVTTFEDDARWRKVCIDGVIVELPKGGSMVVRSEGSSPSSHLHVLVDRSLRPAAP